MRKPALLAVMLTVLALFFGWKTRTALLSAPPVVDGTGQGAANLWRPSAPVPDPAPPPNTSAAVAAIVARPLFRPDRLPYHEQGVAAGRNYDSELSHFMLIGTLTFGGELKGVVVSKGGAASERWEVKAGDQLPGFTVKEVQIDGLALAADGREFMLPLYAGAPPAVGAFRTEGVRAPPPSVPRASVPPRGNPPAAVPPRMRSPRPTYIPGKR